MPGTRIAARLLGDAIASNLFLTAIDSLIPVSVAVAGWTKHDARTQQEVGPRERHPPESKRQEPWMPWLSSTP